jgi:biopolymer transport protein ExbD
MATDITSPAAEPVCDVNTTPLIDVMLVLLIMFIITLPIMTHAVKLDMPQAPPRSKQVPAARASEPRPQSEVRAQPIRDDPGSAASLISRAIL